MSKWLNNPQYLAQVGHLLGGFSLITLTMLLSWHLKVVWIVFVVGCVVAGIKEFWYDMAHEVPQQFWEDSLMDFSFYVLGGGAGVCLSVAALRLHHVC